MLRGHLDPDQADKNLVEYQPIVPNSIDCDIDKPRKCPAYAIMLVDMKLKSTLNILKTLLVMFILVSGTMYFARDAKELVLDPIERMVNVVNRLSDNPLANTEDMMSGASNKDSKKGDDHKYETQLLEQTIVKIGQMLQIGFGAAGASIIGKNMKAGALNPMVPGKMITSIYGFCDIRNFTDTTECLQEEVMVYVNKIGFIVHGCTNDYYGMANKNVGDAFLLSWKICDDLLPGFNAFEDKPDEDARFKAMEAVSVLCKGTGSIERRITPTELADSALVAFLKCLVDMDNANTSGTLSMYLVNKKVVKRFGANFRIKMGFGMHVGWAIEGAIGSSYKIDATYMSPHVEMTDRLEAGSKIFGVPINISHWLYALLSPKARKYLRPMDKILVEGCPTPMTVYTFDVVHYPKTFGVAKLAEDGKTQLAVDFGADPQFNVLQQGLHPAFLDNARKGVEAYLAGQWPEARVIMEMALTQKPKDGPLLRTLGIMSEHNFIAPKNWPGYFEMLEGY
jgi:class 3 adenylate cyclase